MNEHIPVYSWARGGASIHLAQISRSDVQSAGSGQETVAIQMQIQQTLWGAPGERIRVAQLHQPASETSRLKFPDPIWGRVDLQRRPTILLVTQESDHASGPLYVEEIRSAQDPVLLGLREVLSSEGAKLTTGQRTTTYLRWLREHHPPQTLFAAEALAKDDDLKGLDKTGQVAQAFAHVFATCSDVYLRLSVGTWMWEEILQKTNAHGEVAILNASIQGLEDMNPDIVRFSLDQLTTVDPKKLEQPGIVKSTLAVKFLREELQRTVDPDDRVQLQRLINAMPE